jgi:hypothetical protein
LLEKVQPCRSAVVGSNVAARRDGMSAANRHADTTAMNALANATASNAGPLELFAERAPDRDRFSANAREKAASSGFQRLRQIEHRALVAFGGRSHDDVTRNTDDDRILKTE